MQEIKSQRNRMFYGLGHIFNDLCSSMWFSYYLIFLQKVLKIPASMAGIMYLIGQITNGLATPLIGYESDRGMNCPAGWKYGRRKTTHLVGSLCVALSFSFIFTRMFEGGSPSALFFYYVPFVCIFHFGWATVNIAHLSMIPDLSSEQEERDTLSVIRYAVDVATDVSVYMITLIVFTTSGSGPEDGVGIDESDAGKFHEIVWVLTGLGILFTSLFHVGTTEGEDLTTLRASNRKITMKWSDWFFELQFYQVGILLVLSRLFNNLSQIFFPLYLQEAIQESQNLIAVIPLFLNLSGFISSVLIKFIIEIVGKKVCYIFGCLLGFLGCFWLYLDKTENIRAGSIYGISIITGLGNGMMMVLSISLTTDLIGKNTESSAFVFGTINFVEKIINGFLILVVQLAHGTNLDELNFYGNILSHGLSFIALISLAVLLTVEFSHLGSRASFPIAKAEEEIHLKPKSQNYGSLRRGFPLLGPPLDLFPTSS